MRTVVTDRPTIFLPLPLPFPHSQTLPKMLTSHYTRNIIELHSLILQPLLDPPNSQLPLILPILDLLHGGNNSGADLVHSD